MNPFIIRDDSQDVSLQASGAHYAETCTPPQAAHGRRHRLQPSLLVPAHNRYLPHLSISHGISDTYHSLWLDLLPARQHLGDMHPRPRAEPDARSAEDERGKGCSSEEERRDD
jgi:hypothetical protein